MKRYLLNIFCCMFAMMLFGACGGGSSSANESSVNSDGLFGEVPEVVAHCVLEQNEFKERMMDRAKKMTMEELPKLAEEQKKIENKAELEIDAAANNLIGKSVPYEVSEGLFYTITSAPVITSASANGSEAVSLDITYRAAQKEAVEIPKLAYTDYPICYKLVDTEGTPVWSSMIYPLLSNTKPLKLEAGQDYGRDLVMGLSVSEKNASGFKEVVKLVFITKVEYEELKKQLK